MEVPGRILQRSSIWFCCKLGLTGKDTVQKIRACFGRAAYSQATIYRWMKNFQTGRAKVNDLPRSGKPRSAQSPLKVDECDRIIKNDRRIGVHRLSKTLSISYGATFNLLHKDLQLTKRAGKLVPHELNAFQRRKRLMVCQDMVENFERDGHCLNWVVTTDESYFHVYEPRSKYENMQWLAKGQNRPQIPMRERSTAKVLMVPFFDSKGLIHREFFRDQTMDQDLFYNVLKRAKQSIFIRRGPRVRHNFENYLLHMDNAGPHRSYLVKGYLRVNDWNRMPHPAYSPDLSPCDFFLFPILKRKLRGHNFHNVDHLQDAIDTEVGLIIKEQWANCFKDWIRRCRKCIQFGGAYFEGMKHAPEHT